MTDKNIIIIGAPGSGKTSVASLIADRLNLNHISWGKLSRSKKFIQKNSTLISKIKNESNDSVRSELIGDAIGIKLKSELEKNPDKGFIIDGFPRRKEEAVKLVSILSKFNLKISNLILLNASLDSVIYRVQNRLLCNQCGRKYDPKESFKPKKNCPYDKSELVKDSTSVEEIKLDFSQYLDEALPTFDYLKNYSESYFAVSSEDDETTAANMLIKIKLGSKENGSNFIRQSQSKLPTKYGEFTILAYQSQIDYSYHLAIVKGDVSHKSGVLVRVHSSCITGDIFGSKKCDCGPQLQSALKQINRNKSGVVLYLFQEGRGINIINKLKAYKLQYDGLDTVEANEKLGFPAELREYGVVKDILMDLNINSIKLLTNNPDKVHKLASLGIAIEGIVNLEIKYVKENKKYLSTKKIKMGHMLRNV